MKKFLTVVMVLVFALGITGTALADSNPFTDVPQGHWAYAAVDKLAAAGIVDGYGDGTFRGDKTLTRYELAQVVAKALARSDKADAENKALIDKLAVEFSTELNNLGVRVSKLEDKTKIALTYESQIRYTGDSNEAVDSQGSNAFDFRQRVYLDGDVNDRTTYGARLVTGNVNFGTGSSTVGFDRAYFTFKGALFDQLTIGRFDSLGATNGLLNAKTGNLDGVKVFTSLSDNVKFVGAFVDAKPYSDASDTYGTNEVAIGNFIFKTAENTAFSLGYQTVNLGERGWPLANDTTTRYDVKADSLDVGAYTKLGNVYLTGEYVNTKVKNFSVNGASQPNLTTKAYALQLSTGVVPYFYPTFNLVDPTKAHSDAFAISYRKIDSLAIPGTSGFGGASQVATSVSGGANGSLAQDNNVKGYYLTYQNVLSKGVVLTTEYQDLKEVVGTGKDSLYTASLQFFF